MPADGRFDEDTEMALARMCNALSIPEDLVVSLGLFLLSEYSEARHNGMFLAVCSKSGFINDVISITKKDIADAKKFYRVKQSHACAAYRRLSTPSVN